MWKAKRKSQKITKNTEILTVKSYTAVSVRCKMLENDGQMRNTPSNSMQEFTVITFIRRPGGWQPPVHAGGLGNEKN